MGRSLLGRWRLDELPPHFVVTSVVTFLLVTGVNILAPVLPLYATTFGVTSTQVGLVIGVFALGRFVADPLGGALSDRFGFNRLAVAGCVLTGVASIAAAATTSFDLLLVARAVQGVGSALYTTAAMALIISLAPRERVGRLVATYQGVFMLGLAFGPTVGGVVASIGGLRAPFYAYAVMAALGGILAAKRLPARAVVAEDRAPDPQGAEPADRREAIRRLFTSRAFLLSLLLTLMVFWVRSGVRNTLLPLYLTTDFGFSEVMIGLVLTINAVGTVAVLGYAGRRLDRGRRQVILRSSALTAVAVGVFVVLPSGWMLFPASVLLGAAGGYAAAAPSVVLSDVADDRVRGFAVGIQRMATDLGLMVGPVSVGALVDGFGHLDAFMIAALIVAAVALAMIAMPETRPPSTAAEDDHATDDTTQRGAVA